MTDDAPPRKPRGARWWVWVVVVLPLVAYVGTYVALRSNRTFESVDGGSEVGMFIDNSVATGLIDAFEPCILIELWLRNL